MLKKITAVPWRIWILIIALIAAVIIIAPNPWATGLNIHQVDAASPAYELGIRSGQKLVSINDVPIKDLESYNQALDAYRHPPVNITFGLRDGKNATIIVVEDLDLKVDAKLEVLRSGYPQLNRNAMIVSVNGVNVTSVDAMNKEIDKVLPSKRLVIVAGDAVAAYYARGAPEITVVKQQTSRINKGLDLAGGTRVLIKPVSNESISDENVTDMINVLQNRLDVFGLSDVYIREAKDLQGTQYVLIEIAGLSKRDVQKILESQGKFEARIGDDVVFTGGKKDIQFVCRNDGTCSGIRSCNAVSGGQTQCSFQFQIRLSPDAAAHHAEVTKDIPVVTSQSGSQVLEKKIDFYLDDALVSSLDIGADLKGSAVQDIAISGPGVGDSQEAAAADAQQEMEFLQSVLITGSLPYDIEIVKIDTISPSLGDEFLSNAFLVMALALVGVALVIYFRYRRMIIVIPMVLTMLFEIFLTVAFAPILKWNLDLVSIAGIIAAVGTGVDDQIVIADEVLRGEQNQTSWKVRMKNAFFIIFSAYAVTLAAMLPLFRAGAGLVRGFAITTIVGVTIGILITRPAYAAFVEKMLRKE